MGRPTVRPIDVDDGAIECEVGMLQSTFRITHSTFEIEAIEAIVRRFAVQTVSGEGRGHIHINVDH